MDNTQKTDVSRIVDRGGNAPEIEWTVALNREQRDELRAAGCFREVRRG